MAERCNAPHPTLEGVFCSQTVGFHPEHECSIGSGDWVEWPHEPAFSLYAEYKRLKVLGKRNLPTWDEYLARAREHQAEPIEVSSDHRQALIAGTDPRPIWIQYTVSVIGAICKERQYLSAINVWPHVALPTGFGGVGLMAKSFDRAVEEVLCAAALHVDRTPQTYAGDSAPSVYALDGKTVKLPRLIPVYRSLILNK